jgi:hypothetical protein
MRFPFIGPTYASMSYSADCQQTINLYPELVESGNGINNVALYGTPGLSLFATVGPGPIRALWSGENRMFCVSGDSFYEVFGDGTSQFRGNVGNDGLPAQIVSNGNQLMIVSAGQVWIDVGLTGAGPATFEPLSGFCTVNNQGVSVTTIGIATPTYVDTTALGVVTWSSGPQFVAGAAMVGQTATINGTDYTVAASPTPTATSFNVVEPIGAMSGVTLVCVCGDTFDPAHMGVGTSITINGSNYTVSGAFGAPTEYQLYVTTSVPGGLQYGLPWSATPLVTAASGTFLDGYFVVAEPNSSVFRISALLDGTSWDPLDYATKEAYPDHISSVLADHEQLWIFGDERTAEVWVDTGNATFPLQRSPGALIQWGCIAAASPGQLNDGVAWLGVDQLRGGPVAFWAQGYLPKRVSSSAVENAWRQISYVGDAWSYFYIENGHHFWVLNFPTGNQTWVFDATTQMWHQRCHWNGTANVMALQATHTYVGLAAHGSQSYHGPQHYVGDRVSPYIYVQSLGVYLENGLAIHRIRVAPHIQNENKRWFCSKFELLMDITGGTVHPTLDYSKDRGATFVNPQQISSASVLTDPYQARLIWRRLGVSRDRVWRITIADAVPIAVIDGYYEAQEGTGA